MNETVNILPCFVRFLSAFWETKAINKWLKNDKEICGANLFLLRSISTCYTAVTPFNVYLCCAIFFSLLKTFLRFLPQPLCCSTTQLDPNHKHIEPYIFHISVRTHSLLRIQISIHTSNPYFIKDSFALPLSRNDSFLRLAPRKQTENASNRIMWEILPFSPSKSLGTNFRSVLRSPSQVDWCRPRFSSTFHSPEKSGN